MFLANMTPRPLFSIAGTLLSAAVIVACGDPAGSSPVPAGLAILSGDAQTGVAGQPLPRPLVVTVGDVNGRAVEGAAITWELSGAGSISGPSAYTDARGRASATWTLGPEGRTQTARAAVSFPADSSPGSSVPDIGSSVQVTFTATASGAATDLVLVAGDGQAAIIDDTLPVPLRVRAVDLTGAGVAGVRVFWAAAAGGQVFPSLGLTDAQGEAVATWALGPTVGVQTAVASMAGLSGSPLTLTATANPAANTLTWASEQLPSGFYWDIWASSPSDVFTVGAGGTIRHFNGSGWELQNGGTTNDLLGVWGSSSSDVFAAGNGGTILRYDGASWTQLGGTPSDSLRGIWASSPSDVFAVGVRGIWHYDGSLWTQQHIIANCLEAVWGSSARDVWAVGNSLSHYDGTTWSTMSGTSCMGIFPFVSRWFGISGSGPTDVYSFGSVRSSSRCSRGGCPYDSFVDRYDGTSWQRQLNVGGINVFFSGVWAASSADVVGVGANGLILHYDGTRWRRELSGTTEVINAVSGTSARDVWAITSSGLVLHGTR